MRVAPMRADGGIGAPGLGPVETRIPLLEDLLEPWRETIGADFTGYRNHVYRMVHFCFALRDCDQSERRQVLIAAAFHDLGAWTDNTVDYIPPSIPPALAYLEAHDLQHWGRNVELMISEHHKLTRFQDPARPLVELFRRGDLVDFSLGLIRFGLPKAYISQVKTAFPNAGLHRTLMKRLGLWAIRHPLRPVPFIKW